MIDVVLVNWNSGPDLAACLHTLACTPDAALVRRVVVVDNASTDGSLRALPDRVGSAQVTVVRNVENCGFGAACNQGAALGEAPFVLFLNTDIEASAGALTTPTAFLQDPANAAVGICGIRLVDREGHIHASCARFPTPAAIAGRAAGLDRTGLVIPHFMTEWDHGDTRAVDQVMGAFFFVRRRTFSDLGGFDERFFVFYEELDFSLRARQAGWTTVYLAEAQAYHSGEAAGQPSAIRQFYSDRSRILYGYKHFGRGAAATLAGMTLVVGPLMRMSWLAAHCEWGALREAVRATRWLWREAPALVTGGDARQPVPR